MTKVEKEIEIRRKYLFKHETKPLHINLDVNQDHCIIHVKNNLFYEIYLDGTLSRIQEILFLLLLYFKYRIILRKLQG